MHVTLLTHTPDPETACAVAAKLCYTDSTTKQLTQDLLLNDFVEFGPDTEVSKMLKKIMKLGHYSVLEHASFSFGIDGISRACSHQLVRHRLASYSQQSQRYVNLSDKFQYVIPDSIKKDSAYKYAFEKMMNEIINLYQDMIKDGIPKEDARYILPNATETNIVLTMNARELLHFFTLRCCERAQWEIREMANQMLELVKPKAPTIFEDAGSACLRGPCPEGVMSCNKNKPERSVHYYITPEERS